MAPDFYVLPTVLGAWRAPGQKPPPFMGDRSEIELDGSEL
jgi:hypothetical protein